jgi:Zn-dependent peptidase ImmA (M78 family)/transcriptional regulator with XRE-family HTH domain
MPALGAPGFCGARLREAREARGLTSASLAEVMGVTRQVVSQYELDQTSPPPERLFLLASTLNLPAAFFVQPARLTADRLVFFRSQAAATKSERTKAERRLEWLSDVVLYLSRFVEFPLVNFPVQAAAYADAPWVTASIEEAAQTVRHEWGLGQGPIPNVVSLIESHGGVLTRGIVETETIDAFSVRIADDRPAMFLGADKDSAARSRFDAAHELAHNVLHHEISARRLFNPADRRIIEDDANRFASAFLMPASEFARDLRSPTLESMAMAKPRWGVSIGAMIHRCVDLEILRTEEASRLWMARAKRGWNRKEPLDDQMPVEQPGLLRSAIELVTSEGIRTRDQIVSELPFGAGDIEALAGLDAGYLASEAIPIRLIARTPRTDLVAGGGQIIDFPGD